MAKTDKKPAKPPPSRTAPVVRLVAENRKARFRFEILDSLECGIALVGSEVKSLRDGKLSLDEAYARVKEGEVWLVGADIAEYKQATHLEPPAQAAAEAAAEARGDSQVRRPGPREGADARAAEGLFHGPRPGQGAARPVPRQESCTTSARR